MRILLVEDANTLRTALARGLTKAGYCVEAHGDGEAGLDAALVHAYDIVILDLMLPGCDGMEILRQMRAAKVDSEVLLLTARARIEDRVAGLDAGADDYLVKPFAFDELLARVRALMRRRFGDKSEAVRVANLSIDPAAGRMSVDGCELMLQPREYMLLELLARRAGKVVTRTEVMERIYDHEAELRSNSIESAISKIRRALREAGARVSIQPVPRRGYLLQAAEAAASEVGK